MSKKCVQPTICLVSDTTYYPIFFRQHLSHQYHIYPVEAVGFSVSALSGISVNAIVLDDRTFGNSIFSLIREFREKVEFHDIPIIIITGKLRKSYIDRLIKAGANDFIREPLEEDDVLSRLLDVEKYRKLQGKIGGVSDNLYKKDDTGHDLKERFLLNKAAMAPVFATIQKGDPLCVAVVSIDQEEKINVSLSETIGSFLRGQLREKDLMFSLGKANYLVILNQTSSRSGFLITESIKETLTSNTFKSDNKEVNITLSIGVAGQKKPPYATINEMMVDAKNALIQAKDVGDQIVVHH